MKRKHWIGALLFSALAVLLWTYHSRQARWRAEGRALWMDYLRGPFSLSLEVLNEARPWLASSQPWGGAQRQSLRYTAERLQEAEAQVQAWSVQARAHGGFEAVSLAAQVHASLARAAQSWANLPAAPGPARRAAFQFEEQMRQPWAERLDRQRVWAWEKLGQSKEDLLEGNALIYSWKEGFLIE